MMSKKSKIIIWVVIAVLVIVGVWMWYSLYYSQLNKAPEGEENQQINTESQLPIIRISSNGTKTFLIGPNGMTLYVKSGEMNSSTCYDGCAMNWLPLQLNNNSLVAEDGITGQLGTIDRTDGIKQVTYKGMPLYYWVNDKLVGDTTGDGVNNIWSIAQP